MKTKVKAWKTYEHIARQQAIAAINYSPKSEALIAREDLAAFGEYISGFKPAKHHQEWLDQIQTNSDSQCLFKVAGQNLRIAAPRGAAKTTWTSLAIAWIIGHNPHVRIILCSYSEAIALSISAAVKAIIESSKYQEIFPNIQKSKRWSDKGWFINRALAGIDRVLKDPTLLAVGAGGSIASRRADLIIIDDPIKSSESIDNPEVRAAMVKWWSEVLRPCLVPGGRTIVLCTRYRIDDIHGTTFTPDKGWICITQKAIITPDEGEERSYWPEYISLEELIAIREENPTTFASQYQNEPLNEANLIIKPEWIVRNAIASSFDSLILGIDLAASKKESADYTALVLAGRTSKGEYQVIWAYRGRWTLFETCQQIFSLHQIFQGFRIIVESVAYQAAFVSEFKRLSLEDGYQIRCDPIQPKGDKEQRLRGVSGLLETGQVNFCETAPLGILIEEILQFGVTSHDDLVDAFVYSLNGLYKTRKRMTGGSY